MLFAIGYAWLLLHQLPSAIQFVGGAFIFTGVALVRIDELPPAAPAPAAARSRIRVSQASGRTLRYPNE